MPFLFTLTQLLAFTVLPSPLETCYPTLDWHTNWTLSPIGLSTCHIRMYRFKNCHLKSPTFQVWKHSTGMNHLLLIFEVLSLYLMPPLLDLTFSSRGQNHGDILPWLLSFCDRTIQMYLQDLSGILDLLHFPLIMIVVLCLSIW